MFFENRNDAGVKLALKFVELNRDFTNWSVVGIARGGVIVGSEVAKKLRLNLQPIVVDDFQADNNDLYVVTSQNTAYYFRRLSDKKEDYAKAVFLRDIECDSESKLASIFKNIHERQSRYNLGRPLKISDNVIVCDDGLVSGRSALVVISTLKQLGAKQIILGIPVVPPWVIKAKYDFEIITWRVTRLQNYTTGMFYFSFDDTTDKEVIEAVQECVIPETVSV